MHKFAMLFPTDAYGTEFSNLFWDEVTARGGQIVGAQAYDPKETDFRVPVQKLVGTFYQDDRADEYKLRLREWQDKQTRKTNKPPPDNLLPPIVDFDALFIPDSARTVGQIAPMLAYNDVDHVRLIGTNLWNTGDFIKRGQKFVEDAVFADSLMENDEALKSSKFYGDFKQLFQEEPGIFELQAYDSALILRQILAEGESSRLGVTTALSKLHNFAGALGPLSMNENREILRPIINLTVQKGEIIKTAF
jgi:ABC-type branched-subunit amino acid transport system substrate-binding protein